MGANDERNCMHRDVEWMTPADQYIIDYMAAVKTPRGTPAIQRPASISDNVSYSREHINARCLVLAEKGILEHLDRGQYLISEYGLKVAAGEVSIDELNDQ